MLRSKKIELINMCCLKPAEFIEDETFTTQITLINLQRTRVVAVLLIFIMGIMILFDMAAVGANNQDAYIQLRPGIISLRLLFIALSIFYLTAVRIPTEASLISRKHHYYSFFFIITNLILIAVFTGIVQLLRDEISSYLMGIFFVCSFVYLRPRENTLTCGLALFCMGICTWIVQDNKGIFLYNMANASLMTLLAWTVARVLYTNRIQEHRSQQLIKEQAAQLACSNRHLEQLSYRDALTGLANRRCFEEYLYDEWFRAQRNENPISLILVDIDKFKDLNDNYGHQAGDGCLQQISQCLSSAVSTPNSLLARLGGDEYAVVLPNTDLSTAHSIAHEMLEAVRFFRLPGIEQKVTISLGISSSSPSHQPQSLAEFFTEADTALYRAKNMGRDQVAV